MGGVNINNNAQFIESFSKLIRIIQNSLGLHFDEYVESLKDEPRKSQLSFCYMLYSWLTKPGDHFFFVSQQAIDFVSSVRASIDGSERSIKSLMLPIKDAISEKELVIIAADRLSKTNNPISPVFNCKNFAVGAISYAGIVKYVASGAFNKSKKVSNAMEPHKFLFVSDALTVNEVRNLSSQDNQIFLVLNDSKKIVGWLNSNSLRA